MNPTHEIPWSISDFFPLRGRVLRAGPPGPLCFLFFVFSHPPTTSNAQGRPLTERSKTLGPARAAGRGGKSRLNGRIVGGGGGGGFAARVAGGGRTRASSGLSDGCRKQAAEQQQKQEENRSTVWTITVHWRLAGGGGRRGRAPGAVSHEARRHRRRAAQ